MTMKSFDHVNARSLKEALNLISRQKDKVKLIAGGTDLLSILKDKVLPIYPEIILNIKTIPDMEYIRRDADSLSIGGLSRLSTLSESQQVKEKHKILADAARSVGTPQIRNIATLAGNLCQDVRCWYYRYPHSMGGRMLCHMKGGKGCHALSGDNRYHSIFGGVRIGSTTCSSACPAHVNIPLYLSRIREGDIQGAAKILLTENPIPSVTGRVCPHFCESDCCRDAIDTSVSVRNIERFVGDYILDHATELLVRPDMESGKGVAVVGSGPAGLSAAYYLRVFGHQVTVFDQLDKPGGMLNYGIPAYRLPKNVVRRLVGALENMGISFRLNTPVKKNPAMADLSKQFDAVFIATGAWRQPSIGIEGEEFLESGIQFLSAVNTGKKFLPGKRVIVIGGGNAAVDVAISAKRLGAQNVILACLEKREEMPALNWEVEEALKEGVELMPSWGPRKIKFSNSKVAGVELVRCTSVFDAAGRFAPTFNPEETRRVEADKIIMAVGQITDLAFLDPKLGLKTDRELIVVDPETYSTSVVGIFAGGDVTRGPGTVIDAVQAGKKAAAAINFYLNRQSIQTKKRLKQGKQTTSLLRFNTACMGKTERPFAKEILTREKKIDVEDTDTLTFSEIEAEANHCLNCGCLAVQPSDLAVALLALDAKITIAGPKGMRTVSMEKFINPSREIFANGEIVAEIRIPDPPTGSEQTFLKFRLREPIDFSVVSVACVISSTSNGTCRKARIVLGGVAPIPLRVTKAEKALEGKVINAETAEKAAEGAVAEAIPLIRNGYKVEIAKTLVRRGVMGQQ